MKQLTEYQQILVAEHMDLVNIVIRSKIIVSNCSLETHEDFFQIGCEALCRAALSYDPNRSSFKTYASRIIYHALVDHCREQNEIKNAQCNMDVYYNEYRLAAINDCEETILAKDIQDVLRRAKENYTGVNLLGVEAIELKLAGLNSKEIAAMYGTTVKNVNAWISRARVNLSRDLACN